MVYAEHFRRERRLAVLRTLAECSGHKANDRILACVAGTLGVVSTIEEIRTELDWLSDQGLITGVAAGYGWVATATERGLDVAAGRAACPGVGEAV